LQLLEDEGVIRSTETEGRRVYELTETGQAEAAAAGPALPWDGESSTPDHELRRELRQLHLAARQVGVAGNVEGLERATVIVREARQALYRILAET
jgi:DNA-binding PadR family transcriptional regulator